MIEILSPAELVRARAASALVGDILAELRELAAPGVTLLDLDARAAQLIDAAGAVSCYVDYAPSFGDGPFGHHLCTTVNDAVLHGMPHDTPLADGDLLTLDLALTLRGISADAAVPGGRLGDVSAAIGCVLTGEGHLVNTEFGGHGIGSTMHQDPHVPNDGRPGRGLRLRPGLLLALEPWVMDGTDQLVTDADGWTLRSANGGRAAHTEHTIAITEDGPEILTLPSSTGC